MLSREHIAVLLFRRVGDSLLATPAIRALRKSNFCSKLSVVCEEHVARVFARNPWVDRVVSIAAPATLLKLTRALREQVGPSVTIDLLSDPRSGLSCYLSRCPHRVGFDRGLRRFLYTHRVSSQDPIHPLYSADHKLRAAVELGAVADGLSLDFVLTDDDKLAADREWSLRRWNESTCVAAFFVHSRRPYKRWPLHCFADVIRVLRSRHDCETLLLSTPGTGAATTELRDIISLSEKNVIEVTDLGVLAAILTKSAVFVGNDGGPKHLSVAVGTPTVTVFVHESPRYWTPPDDPRHIGFEGSGGNMSDRSRGIDPILVAEAAGRFMQAVA